MKMKLFAVLSLLVMCLGNNVSAQLPNGSTAPDFTFTDIDGRTQHLYSYLNAGKYVVIDASTTWCNPCWTYHQTGTMDSFYLLHDSVGDNTAKVLFIEGDGGTDLTDLQGTGTSTQGNWLAGTLFTVINPPYGAPLNDFRDAYNLNFWPTFTLICPDKKVYTDTLNSSLSKPTVKTWEYVANRYCAPAGIDNMADENPVAVYPNPASQQMSFYFSLKAPSNVTVVATDVFGKTILNMNEGALQAGDNVLHFDISHLTAGMYFFTLTTSTGRAVRKKVSVY